MPSGFKWGEISACFTFTGRRIKKPNIEHASVVKYEIMLEILAHSCAGSARNCSGRLARRCGAAFPLLRRAAAVLRW